MSRLKNEIDQKNDCRSQHVAEQIMNKATLCGEFMYTRGGYRASRD
jgi:hypothetical protein